MFWVLYAACLSVAALAVRGAFAIHPVVGWVSVVVPALIALAAWVLYSISRPDAHLSDPWVFRAFDWLMGRFWRRGD